MGQEKLMLLSPTGKKRVNEFPQPEQVQEDRKAKLNAAGQCLDDYFGDTSRLPSDP